MRFPRTAALVVAVLGVTLMTWGRQAVATDVGSISVIHSENRLAGVTAGYAVNFQVAGTGITSGKAVNTDTGREFALTFRPVTNTWGFDNTFTSLTTFQNFHSTAPTAYRFYLNECVTTPGVWEDQVLLDLIASEPKDYAHITYPANGQTGVPLNPTYTWDNTLAGLGLWALGLRVRNAAQAQVYGDYPEANTALTSWTPGPLVPGSYSLVVEDYNITTVTGGPMSLATMNGDGFTYYGLNGQSNTVRFTTVPEPVSLVLVGTAGLALVGLRRRRSMK